MGWRVVAVDRRPSEALRPPEAPPTDATLSNDEAGTPIHRVYLDLAAGLPDDLPVVDLVIHAAWITTGPEQLGVTGLEYMRMNLDPLDAVLRYVVEHRPDAFVFLSSSGVFAHGDATHRLTDAHRPSARGPYGSSKRAAELLVPESLAGVTQAHVVRLGYLFGPDEWLRPSRLGLSPVARWIEAARQGQALEVRVDDPRRDWTYTPDLALALERLVRAPARAKPVHLTSGHVVRDRVLAGAIAQAAGGRPLVETSVTAPLKPPMVPSELAVLADFTWTEPLVGLRPLIQHLKGAA